MNNLNIRAKTKITLGLFLGVNRQRLTLRK